MRSVGIPSADYRFPAFLGKRERCQKCGGSALTVEYSGRGWVPSAAHGGHVGIDYPHLHIICGCGFSWVKAPLDAK